MAEPRELILKLGQKITDRIGVKVTENDPEYWGLAGVVTDEMAEVALAMKVRVPATAAEVAKKCKKSVERTEELLEQMSVIGLIEYNRENEDHHKQYILPMFVPGCAEFMVSRWKHIRRLQISLNRCQNFRWRKLHLWFRWVEQESECMLFR